MDATTAIGPDVTAAHLIGVLADPEAACVWLPAIDDVDVAALTDRHRSERHVRVLFGFEEAIDYLLAAAGNMEAAAALAAGVIGRQFVGGLL